MKKCRECREGELVITRKNHRYAESGLSNVILQDVEVRECPACGAQQVVIPRMDELYRALALALVRKHERLEGEEVRFLRKHMGWSGRDFAAHMGVTPETASRWETDPKHPISPTGDRLLRLMIVRDRPVEDYGVDELAKIEEKQAAGSLILLKADRGGWHEESAAA